MIANGTSELNGISNNLTSSYYYGVDLAAITANKELEALNFEYKFIPTDCGNLIGNLSWSIPCLSKFKNTSSIAYLTSFWMESIIPTLLGLRELKINIPQLSPGGDSDYLNKQKDYPEYLKLTGKFDIFISNTFYMFNFYNWKDIMVLFLDSESSRMQYNEIKMVFDKMGINIVNPEESRFIPETYTRDDFERYKHLFNQIKNSLCRIFVIRIADPGFIFEALYDIGLRKGDLIVVGCNHIHFSLLENSETNFFLKRQEIYAGALISNHVEFEGDFGQSIEKELKKKYKVIMNMCLTYDGFKTISNSVKYLISRGEDYEDLNLLMKTMRTQKFIGCSGEVYFIPDENSRNKPWLGFLQLVINSTSNEYDFVPILKINKFAVIAAEVINSPVWPTGGALVPSCYRVNDACLYKSTSRLQNSSVGLYIFSCILLIIVMISSYVSIRMFKYEMNVIKDKVNLFYYDAFTYGFIICHFFQILALEPSRGLLNRKTNKLNLKLGLEIIEIGNLKMQDYWQFYLVLLLTVGIYVLLTVFVLMSNKYCLRIANSFCIFKVFITFILPVIGNFGFIPLSLMLLSIFKCEKDDSIGAVFSRDCTQYCYKGKHLLYLVFGSVFISLYLSLSTILRPYWEMKQSTLNINTKVSFFGILSIFQVALILCKVLVGESNQVLQGYFLSCLIFCFIIVIVKIKPFNYERLNIFITITLSINFWVMIFSSTELILGYETQMIIAMFCGIFVILIIGLKVQSRYPKKFISDPHDAIQVLIRFQFTRKHSAYISASKYLSANNKGEALANFSTNVVKIINY